MFPRDHPCSQDLLGISLTPYPVSTLAKAILKLRSMDPSHTLSNVQSTSPMPGELRRSYGTETGRT